MLMAPHHGGRTANTPELAVWASPRVVVSCQGPTRGWTPIVEPYTERGSCFLGTWPQGAITLRSSADGLTVETFRTGQRIQVASPLP
jgi:competence protein ComEC